MFWTVSLRGITRRNSFQEKEEDTLFLEYFNSFGIKSQSKGARMGRTNERDLIQDKLKESENQLGYIGSWKPVSTRYEPLTYQRYFRAT